MITSSYLVNSTIVAAVSAVVTIILVAPLSFLISRGRVRGSYTIFFAFLTTRMAPSVAIALPLYWLFSGLGAIDTYGAIILSHIGVNVAVAMWLLRVVFDAHNAPVEEAAQIDGRSLIGAFVTENVRLALPGIGMTALLLFCLSWGETFLAYILTGFDRRPVSAAVMSLITPQGTYWGQIAAVATVSLLPPICLAWLAQAVVRRRRSDRGD